MTAWCHSLVGLKIIVIECGASTAVPTVRRFSEERVDMFHATLLRINVREPETPEGFGIAEALETLERIDAALGR